MDQQFTFGSKLNRPERGMSPKTHLESDSNFENFLQRYDRGKQESHESEINKSKGMERVGSDKPNIPKSRPKSKNTLDFKNLNDDSDLQFSTDRSRDYGHVKGSFSNLPTAHQKSSQGLFGVQQTREDAARLTKATDEYRLNGKLNSSYEMSKPQESRDQSRAAADNGKKSILMDLDSFFPSKKKAQEEASTNQGDLPTPIKHKYSPLEEKDTSLKNSIVMFEQDLQSIRNRAMGKGDTNWRSSRNQESSGDIRNPQRDSENCSTARVTDLFMTKTPRQGNSSRGGKSSQSRYFMSPLTIQKFCKVVQRTLQRGVLQKLSAIVETKRETSNLGLLMLADCITAARKRRARELLLALQEYPLIVKRTVTCLEIMRSLIEGKMKNQKRVSFAQIVKSNIESASPRLTSLLDKLSEKGTSFSGTALLKIAAEEEHRMETLAKLLNRKQRAIEQSARKAFQIWSHNDNQLNEVALVRGSRKLGALLTHRHASDLLRGYYGIKAAGGRLDKLLILLLKNQKIYAAQTKYSLKKLRIWNKFKSNVSHDYGNVKTIIVRTSDPMEEQRTNTLRRMFYRKAFDCLADIFKCDLSASKAAAFDLLNHKYLASIGREKVLIRLLDILQRRSLRLAWIELSIIDLKRRTEERESTAKKAAGCMSPGLGGRGRQTAMTVQNPLFRYFESRQQDISDVVGHDQSQQKVSIDLEILKSGLDLDEKIQQMAGTKELYGARRLEQVLMEENRMVYAPDVAKASSIRSLSMCLLKLYRKRTILVMKNLKLAATKKDLSQVQTQYMKFGFQKMERILAKTMIKSIKSALRTLQQLSPRSKSSKLKLNPPKAREVAKKVPTPGLIDLRKTSNRGLSKRIEN